MVAAVDAGQHLGLVFREAQKAARGLRVSFDDLVQEGTIGLINAARRFDPTRGVPFSSYATYFIRGCIYREIQRQFKAQHGRPVDEAEEEIHDNGPVQAFEALLHRDQIALLLAVLNRREKRVVTLYYGLRDGKPLSLAKVARRMRLVHKQRVHYILVGALAKLRLAAQQVRTT